MDHYTYPAGGIGKLVCPCDGAVIGGRHGQARSLPTCPCHPRAAWGEGCGVGYYLGDYVGLGDWWEVIIGQVVVSSIWTVIRPATNARSLLRLSYSNFR